MKKFFYTALLLLLFAGGFYPAFDSGHSRDASRRAYEQKIHELAVNAVRGSANPNGAKAGLKPDSPEMAAFQEYLSTMDPATGKIPNERLLPAYRMTRDLSALKSGGLQWTGLPVEMGGRTRMLVFDPNDLAQKKVWAGAVTGGLWYNPDVTSIYTSWVPAGDFWSNLSVSCMAFDPQNTQVCYVGTGEVETALITYRESSGLGTGIWKSTDGGQTWNQLPSTTAFCFIPKIIVRNEGGVSVIYAGVASGQYHGVHQSAPSDGLFRSADGGNTWTQVLPDIPGESSPYAVSDLALGSDGRIYLGTRPNLAGKGGANILFSDTGTAGSWTVNGTYEQEILGISTYGIPGRVVLATAQSDPNVVYALIAGGYIDPVNNFQRFNCVDVLRSGNRGVSWVKKFLPMGTDTASFATIAWHALAIAVNPANPDQIYAGGLDVHRSSDGGTNWQKLTDWSLMYYGGGPAYVHADQHVMTYRPGHPNEMIFGCDGGVFYTSTSTSITPLFEQHNHNYRSLQFYTCDLNPSAGVNAYIGGLQDNGTLYYTGTPITINDMIIGGDGAFCLWDKNDPQYFMGSYYYNHFTFFMNGAGIGSVYTQSGIFLNPADLDYKLNLLYANATDFTGTVLPNTIVRYSNIYTSSPGQNYINLGTGLSVYFSAVTYSPYSPSGKTTLFVGSVSGRLYKVENAHSNAPQVNEITGSAFPNGSISCIALGGSEDTLMVLFSNYGVNSVWKSDNGGTSWTEREGNLPDMPVRWGMFYPGKSDYAVIATETGVWGTGSMNMGTVTWEPCNEGMANVRTDMIKYRTSDHKLLAATHGRGLFTASWDVITGMKDHETGMQDVSLSPNPTSGVFSIEFSKTPGTEVVARIYSASGKMVHSRVLNTSKNRETFDLSGNSPGVYLMKLSSGNRIIAEKKILLW
jgi:hypothetical protein